MAKQTISVAAEHAKKQTKTERRAWVRFPSSQQASCRPMSLTTEELGWQGEIRDVSQGGIALVLSRRFEPGAVLMVELSSKAGESGRQIVRVVHATPETNGRWIVGCAFVNTLSEEELQAFIRD
jgi:PilZ domain